MASKPHLPGPRSQSPMVTQALCGSSSFLNQMPGSTQSEPSPAGLYPGHTDHLRMFWGAWPGRHLYSKGTDVCVEQEGKPLMPGSMKTQRGTVQPAGREHSSPWGGWWKGFLAKEVGSEMAWSISKEASDVPHYSLHELPQFYRP